MASDEVVNFLARNVGGRKHSCRELQAYAVQIVKILGYTHGGISKGSLAAQGMSLEAKANEGGVPSMKVGGITAALQSIGATGSIKKCAARALHDGLIRCGIKRKRKYIN